MQKNVRLFSLTVGLLFLHVGPQFQTVLEAQEPLNSVEAVSNFDQKTVADWLSRVKGWEPELFSATLCVNQGFMERDFERSCLLEQTLFLLKDINVRRQANEAGLRQILEQSEAQRLALSNLLDEKDLIEAESAKKAAETKLALAKALERIKQLENAQLQMQAEIDNLQRKQRTLTASRDANLRATKAALVNNAQLKTANKGLREAYQDLANRLASGVKATTN